MNKNTEIFGIDISKDVFDVYSHQKGHQSFKNDAQGFKSFLKVITKDALVVMEATGYYHYLFAQFLHKKEVQVSVVNPLSVKRFIQMKLAKIKTDKLNNFKIPTLQEEKTPVQTEVVSQPTPEPVADARAVDWAKQNTWFGQDEEMTSLALGLHNKLAKQGIDLQSDEYYEAIDTRMRQVFPDNFEEIPEQEAEKQKKARGR